MLRTPSRSSMPPSITTSPTRSLDMAAVANLVIRARRLANKAKKASHTVLTSGEPKSHPSVVQGVDEQNQVPVEYVDRFVCAGGVNVTVLLRATRASLLELVDNLGANTLVEEQWECNISRPKSARNGTYKVEIRYIANATRSSACDPQRPIALEEAKNIPGLMTIVERIFDL